MIDLSNVSLQFNGKYLFDNVSFKIHPQDRISLVGANGSGKSSLLKIIAGIISPESGIVNKSKNISIGYLPQEIINHSANTLIDEAKSALSDIILLQNKETEISDLLLNDNLSDEQRDDLISQLGNVHQRLQDLDSYTAESKVEKILIGLGFEEDDFLRQTTEFSGGWQMRIELAKILISQPDILLLDEPTNHLDIESLNWLIDFLNSYPGALLIVSHDKHFINSVTNRTFELYLNKFYRYSGNYDDYIKYKEERDKQAESVHLQQIQKIKETQKFIERFRYKASKAKQVQSRIKQLEKIELVDLPESTDNIEIYFPEPPRSGKTNLVLKNLSKSYGTKKIFDNLNFQIDRGDKIAFLGPNGAGKTTLAKIIAGVINFEIGERIIGYNTIVSYYAQDVADALDAEADILETVLPFAGDKSIGQVRSILGSFLFSGDDVFKKVSVLSGGEKSRVALAKILLTKANLIVLDEPTNHLDFSSKAVLQKALCQFSGSLVLVSHDIDFLRPIVNKVLYIKPGFIKEYLGGVDYFLDKKTEPVIQNKPDSASLSTGLSNKKQQKKLEAEKRQKKYLASKDLINELSEIENLISEKELREKEIERFLSEPQNYDDSNNILSKSKELQDLKSEIEKLLERWESISEKLEEIEKMFK